jgi:hypothetical protein
LHYFSFGRYSFAHLGSSGGASSDARAERKCQVLYVAKQTAHDKDGRLFATRAYEHAKVEVSNLAEEVASRKCDPIP